MLLLDDEPRHDYCTTQLISSPCCDVILLGTKPQHIYTALESIKRQTDALAFIHLVDLTDTLQQLYENQTEKWRITYHTRRDPINSIIKYCQTGFIAFQSEQHRSLPLRLNHSIACLLQSQAEILTTSITHQGETYPAQAPAPFSVSNAAHWETVVMHKSVFVDLGGFGPWDDNLEIEFLLRAIHDARQIHFSPLATVEGLPGVATTPPLVRQKPAGVRQLFASISKSSGRLNGLGAGFPSSTCACDVILPFCNNISSVEAALTSILAQERIHPLVHLVDDCSSENTADLFSRWDNHPQVKLYRNERNVGQFMSVNAVIPYCQSNFLAIQDGDDLSDPLRLVESINRLLICNADVFGANFINQGGALARVPWQPDPIPPFEITFHQGLVGIGYFCAHPTLVIRKDALERVNGYTNFGDPRLNKSSGDLELIYRLLHSGAEFCISRLPLVFKRISDQSCSQNEHTGWGSITRKNCEDEVYRRVEFFRYNRQAIRAFGALDKPMLGIAVPL